MMSELTEEQKLEKIARFGFDRPERRTIRRYAHELYPHSPEDEARALAVDVPYLYARAIGFEVWGTGWFGDNRELAGARTMLLIEARRRAFLADALFQGMSGQEAWQWAGEYSSDETGELLGERAVIYGVQFNDIKPYPCGPEPDHHRHHGAPDARGWQVSTRAEGKESECEDCTEFVPEVESTTNKGEVK